MADQTKTELFDNLNKMLTDLFELRAKGAAGTRLARAHGVADGYMQMLIDSGIATQAELLALVSRGRSAVAGPGSRRRSGADSSSGAAETCDERAA